MYLRLKTILLLICLFLLKTGFGQGRVVINEYMPWTLNGCGTTAEFVELMNFGPGPVDIGCYILTDGDFSVTIPPNTILQPGQYFVIAGQDEINAPCANINATIQADLNWNNCDCTSDPIPTSGSGFFTDGGSANEQVVLLDANLEVVDAVVRSYPVEPSSVITTSGTHCPSQTFDLDDMNINYETLGMSTGRGNSFARKLDGDCGWVKDPQQSADASNNTSGDVSDVAYEFSIIDALDCSETHGSVYVYVKRARYDDFFPMNYTLAFDANNDGVLDFNDNYTFGSDDTAPDIFIDNLPIGRYRLTVESVYGCSLQSFDFQILPCQPALPVKLEYFRHSVIPGQNKFQWKLVPGEELSSITLEKAKANNRFVVAKTFHGNNNNLNYEFLEPLSSPFVYYRLKVVYANGSHFYSSIIDTRNPSTSVINTVWPNPARDRIMVQQVSVTDQKLPFAIYNLNGTTVLQGVLDLKTGTNSIPLEISSLPPGIYQLRTTRGQSISFRFVKH